MFRSMYPLNVHLATTGKSEGVSIQTKKSVALVLFIALTIIITIASYAGGAKLSIGILTGVIGFLVSIILDIFLYNWLLRDKFNESFESDSENKIFRIFRVRMSDTDTETLAHGVIPSYYTSGELFITLKIEIGQVTEHGNLTTEQFLDRLFKAAHQLGLQIKGYSLPSEWRKSAVYHSHLKRLAKVHDSKLRSTLSVIDAYQATIFEKSVVQAIHLVFYTRRKNIYSLNALVNFVEEWRLDEGVNSSIREILWLDKKETVDANCAFLGLKMLDITRGLTKKNVKYDARKLVKVYSKARFDAARDVEVESQATIIRKRKQ